MKTPDDVAKFFAYAHLPEDFQKVSKPFHDLAMTVIDAVPESAERTLSLRKLWDAKNYAVWCVAQEANDGA